MPEVEGFVKSYLCRQAGKPGLTVNPEPEKLKHNIKRFEFALPFLPGFMDHVYSCSRWPVAAPRNEFGYLFFQPFCQDLNCSIRPVPDTTENTQRNGLPSCGLSEPHPLNPAFNYETYPYVIHCFFPAVSIILPH